jgi:aminoglycoside N3'-acetyltransferase
VRVAKRRFQSSVDAELVCTALRGAGVSPGDVVVVHSSLSRLGKVDAGPSTVVDGVLAAVGDTGVVLMPVFGDADEVLARAEPVDLREEPSRTGAVTEHFRRRPGVRRSSHPFSSLAASGPHAGHFTSGHALDPRIAHKDSPLGRLLEADGKIVGLGVSLGPVSFYHVLEDTWDGFPLSVYGEPQEVTYIDAAGESVTRPIRQYEPGLRRTRIDMPDARWIRGALTDHLERRGILQRFSCGEGDGWIMAARALYDEQRLLAERGVTIYSTEASAPAPTTW